MAAFVETVFLFGVPHWRPTAPFDPVSKYGDSIRVFSQATLKKGECLHKTAAPLAV
jgi:hypothetical protein